jgi:HSP20 family protein
MNMMTRSRDQNTASAERPAVRARNVLSAQDLMNAIMPAVAETAAFVPSVEVYEQGGNYVIDMAVPGFNRDDIDIEVSGSEITISGKYERKQEDRKTHYSEMQQASFTRTIVLPHDINADKVTATLDNGILHITAPPVAPISAKKIAIKGETQ